MLRLISMCISNLGPFYGVQLIDLSSEPNTPVSLIVGANGSGKTSIITALGWGLYGKEYQSDHHLVINKAAAKAGIKLAFVELIFRYGERLYTLKRLLETQENTYPKGSKNSLIVLDITDVTTPVGLDNPQSLINSILPLSVAKLMHLKSERVGDLVNENSGSTAIAEAIDTVLALYLNTVTVKNISVDINQCQTTKEVLRKIERAVNELLQDLDQSKALRFRGNEGSIKFDDSGRITISLAGSRANLSMSEIELLGIITLCETLNIISDEFFKLQYLENELPWRPSVVLDYPYLMDQDYLYITLTYLSNINFPLILISSPLNIKNIASHEIFSKKINFVSALVMHEQESRILPDIGFEMNGVYTALLVAGSSFEGTEVKRIGWQSSN